MSKQTFIGCVVFAMCNCLWASVQRDIDFNFDWKFALQTDDASAADYDDSTWRSLRVPHDWSVEASFDPNLEGCTAYLPGGMGWYRKHFSIDLEEGQVAYLVFDGIYNRSTVWLNGTQLVFHPYGYSPLQLDITPHLRRNGQPNVLAVQVDRTRYADSRWYTGGGIYRNVVLHVVNAQHIPIWGTFVTTPEVSDDKAIVAVEVTLKNAAAQKGKVTLRTDIVAPDGQTVAQHEKALTLSANQEKVMKTQLTVIAPQRWDIKSPHLYYAVFTLLKDGAIVDTTQTRFGIRSFRFDAATGFYLNDRNLLIKGVCLHHDGGLVGAAVPKGVWKRRLQTLKAGGCNAIRSAHNPASEEFLDLCDEMGLLVQNEFYDEWDNPKDKRLNCQEQHDDYISRGHAEYFQTHAEKDLKSTMLRDRNHPSIFQWSIGNEIEWTYARYRHVTGYFDANWEGNYFWTPPHIGPTQTRQRYEETETPEYVCADTAQKLAAWTRELDTTRPVTANCILPSASHVTGYADALDVVGYSYRRVVYDYARKHFPDKVVMGTENLGQWHEWKAVLERPAISGLFLWTGIDYMGEANEKWPVKGIPCGLLDTTGFEKPSFHMYRTLWSETPHIYLATQTLEKSLYKLEGDSRELIEKESNDWKQRTWIWQSVNNHWNYKDGESMVVEVYANSDRVELFLNKRSLGVKSLSDNPDRTFKWAVPYQAGTLRAVASHGAQAELVTAGKPAGIVLTADTNTMTANHYDVVHVTAQLVDAAGLPVKAEEHEIVFTVEGPVRSLGVDNGSLSTVEAYQSERIKTSQGRCLTILQAQGTTGSVRVQATAGDLTGTVFIKVAK